jgi:EmrB/QacA subfamily drug resistance transporter
MSELKKIFAVACVGIAMPNLDLFSVNIALPRIAGEFKGVPLEELSWILNAYAIAFASLLLFFGRLAEGYRRDRSFMLGIGIFTIAAAASALATGVWELVVYRVVAAAGAALMTPTSIGLILATFPSDQRAAAVRGWAGIGGFAAAMGPLVGGALVSIDWRWVFMANAIFGASALLIGWRHLPNVPGHEVTRPSVLAAMLVTTGIAALIFAIIKINAWGWNSPGVMLSAFASAALLSLFALHSIKSINPLVDPALFKIRPFTGASLAMIPYSVSFGAMLFSISVWGQSAWGWSALQAGLAVIPGPLMVPLTSKFLTEKLIDRMGVAYPVSLGILLIIAGLLVWFTMIGTDPILAVVIAGMILNGIGVGLVFPALMGVATHALPPASFATGSGVINMLRQACIAVGVAIFVAIVGTPTSLQQRLDAFHLGWLLMAVITVLTLIPVYTWLRPTRDQKRQSA